MKLVVGLGNPGKQYQNTRHNLGFYLLDNFAKKKLSSDIIWEKSSKFEADLIKIDDYFLVKPLTFMNNSGLAVKKIADFYQIKTQDISIVHDELDLPLGKIKIKVGGGSAGHNGIESIIKSLGSDQFIRVRVGIDEKTFSEEMRSDQDASQYVLAKFSPKQNSELKEISKKIIEILDLILENKLEEAQNKFHSM